MENQQNNISKSKQKRINRQNEIRQNEINNMKRKIIPVLCIAGITAVLAGGTIAIKKIGVQKYLNSEIVAETDFSAYLTDDGKIEDVKTTDYIKDFDLSDITINSSDVAFTDEDLDNAMASLTEEYETVSVLIDTPAKEGDKLKIDYVGTIDGEEFSGGSAENQSVTIGSGEYMDGFEEQLIGALPNDDITINVTFPDDYGVDELNGKDAVFNVHVDGFYVTPEFNDEFVTTYLSSSGYTTAEEYKEAYRKQQTETLYVAAIDSWIANNISLDDYPEVFLHHEKGIMMANDEYMFSQYKDLYEQYGMDFDYDSYEDFYTTEDQTYEEYRDEEAKAYVRRYLVYQYIFEKAGLSISTDDYNNYVKENNITDETVESYGKPYIMQQLMLDKTVEYLKDVVTVTDDTTKTSTETNSNSQDETSSESSTVAD